MKIQGEIPKVPKVYDSQKNISKADVVNKVIYKKDVVSISSQGREFQTVMKALKNVPDIRKDKVEKIEKQIQSGDYKVSGEDIADSILRKITEKKI
ncbi:MAG TPA: flagellar biosynthesis anti-sigma factor FlgM [Ruminiclostridium sp.]|jgi:negative regulator of flagellin synthesis FlgM|uniref:Negative regulator of flagellin synthesis n=1 Tax=Acetivibrio saccincola TaxID=1677857 RepID=A0A2K9DXG0_9FIRM|nr:flagellar biosynthesis anti-sigma factor FlgM [Acetivibrio saccincola]HAA43420.1 flagellar biosynthesis anti-sigma factor FlgM [Ruminiclostridium sp.]AUG56247.1 Anti-sigma-28 factor, FlgM [Acetivibrio saccincola]NLW26093.1 flagellar biosynthesis anti-sigma factor FlgM [Acetivibrio saccincola]PQQ65569.1 flagellar biosynthesis anti-sigma factor FlgM [Acetivibrio saccincola]HOA96428.1 flagellar biosynthesis anti-sigma factor FlgM [Acetivibrio saccincola]